MAELISGDIVRYARQQYVVNRPKNSNRVPARVEKSGRKLCFYSFPAMSCIRWSANIYLIAMLRRTVIAIILYYADTI